MGNAAVGTMRPRSRRADADLIGGAIRAGRDRQPILLRFKWSNGRTMVHEYIHHRPVMRPGNPCGLRLVAAALAAVALHCQPRTTVPAAATDGNQPMSNPRSIDATVTAGLTPCALALRALGAGDYAGWHGLTASCTTADAVAALGPGSGDRSGSPGGSPTRYRIHPPSVGAPHGLNVYDVQDRIVLVITHDAVPARGPEAQLGAPEARLPSRMPGFKTQWIWASRGLTLHVDDTGGEVAWLYAYAPSTVDAFKTSWMARVEIHRTRVR